MPGLADYLLNWKKMIGAGSTLDTGQPPAQAAPAPAPQPNIDPATGQPKAANYGQDADLPQMADPAQAAMVNEQIAQLRKMGYPEPVAIRIVLQQQQKR